MKIQYLTSRAQGPATRNQLVIRMRAEFCDNLQRRISRLLMKKRHLLPVLNLFLLSSPSLWLWLLMAVTYSFLLHLVHPSQKASLSPQGVFPALCPICL